MQVIRVENSGPLGGICEKVLIQEAISSILCLVSSYFLQSSRCGRGDYCRRTCLCVIRDICLSSIALAVGLRH
jgi:hypothetical protein